MPEYLPSDAEIWFSILDKTLKENGITIPENSHTL